MSGPEGRSDKQGEQGDPASVVKALLAAAGITTTDDELVLFGMMYPLLRHKADRIYELDLGDRS
jgi:hypothetical protein